MDEGERPGPDTDPGTSSEDATRQNRQRWSAPELIRRRGGGPEGGPNALTPDNPTENGTVS